MALSRKDKETDRFARQLTAIAGETLTEAIRKALAERLARERLRRSQSALAGRLMEIGRHCAALPDIDTRSPDEIVEYDETGMWRWMVADTSTLVAILLGEPDADVFARALADARYGCCQ